MSRSSRSSAKAPGQRADKPAALKALTTSSRATPTRPASPQPLRKTDRLIAMLRAEQGASIEEISTELGWLPHSTRAALTGLRKAGHDIERLKLDDGPSRYRISSSRSPASRTKSAPEAG